MLEMLSGKVRIEDGVVFGSTGTRDLKGDLFLPPGGGDRRPGVVIIHGGGWYSGDRKQLRYYGIQLARYGFVGLACEYRLSGEASWPAQLHDVKAAVRWLRAQAPSLGVDEAKICLTGNSAGAHLALMAAARTEGQEGEGGNPEVSSRCAAVSAIYPPHGDPLWKKTSWKTTSSAKEGTRPWLPKPVLFAMPRKGFLPLCSSTAMPTRSSRRKKASGCTRP